MTSDGDFREGDLMNIYHNGFNEDGLGARLLVTSGGHCAVDGAQLQDALAFVSRPMHRVVEDSFASDEPETGDGVLTLGAVTRQGALLLSGSTGTPAGVVLRNRVHWADRAGMVLRVTLSPASTGTLTLTLRPVDPGLHGADGSLSLTLAEAPELG